MAKQYLYHSAHDVLYHYIEETAAQVRAGHLSDLILIDGDDPRAKKHLPKEEEMPKATRGSAARKAVVELPAELLTTAKE